MAPPRKYKTEEERLAAKRTQSRASMRRYRAKHPEKVRAQCLAWHRRNADKLNRISREKYATDAGYREHCKESARAYYAAHREERREIWTKYNHENRKKRREYMKVYERAHREEWNAKERERHARRRSPHEQLLCLGIID